MTHRVWTGTFPDGSQLLVEQFIEDGIETIRAATRPRNDTRLVWQPPITLKLAADG